MERNLPEKVEVSKSMYSVANPHRFVKWIYVLHMLHPYTLRRIKRSRRMTLSVKSNASIVVTAPFRISKRDIDAFVFAQKQWIDTMLIRQKERAEPWEERDDVRQETFHSCKARSLKFVRNRLAHYAPYYDVVYQRVSVKEMSSRWGSCSHEGNLSFHWRLMFLPIDLADYVIVHELCHLKELNHSPRFWRLVGETVPDWKQVRKLLKAYVP